MIAGCSWLNGFRLFQFIWLLFYSFLFFLSCPSLSDSYVIQSAAMVLCHYPRLADIATEQRLNILLQYSYIHIPEYVRSTAKRVKEPRHVGGKAMVILD